MPAVANTPNFALQYSPHHFKKTRVSTIASMKMVRIYELLELRRNAGVLFSQLQHALYGVEQGRKTSATGAPIEIMGLCVGHIDAKDPSAFVLTDVSGCFAAYLKRTALTPCLCPCRRFLFPSRAASTMWWATQTNS